MGFDFRGDIRIVQSDVDREGFRRGSVRRGGSEHTRGARVHNPVDGFLPGHRQDVLCSRHVHLEHPLHIPDAQLDPAGHVEHDVRVGHRGLERRDRDVSGDDLRPPRPEIGRPGRIPREDRDLPVPPEEEVHEGAADEPRAPRDEGPHRFTLPWPLQSPGK
jgi:hypothetical protein